MRVEGDIRSSTSRPYCRAAWNSSSSNLIMPRLSHPTVSHSFALLKIVPITQLLFRTDIPYGDADDQISAILSNPFTPYEVEAIFF